jgi:hypothetical protein
MVVIPFPESKADSSAVMTAPSQSSTTIQPMESTVSPFLK